MSFTPLPVHVRTARLVATAVARRSGVEEALLDEVRLAVGEACSRAVEAHREHCPGEPVRIALTSGDGRFEVVVTDAAAAGDASVTGRMADGGSTADDENGAGPGSDVGEDAGLTPGNGWSQLGNGVLSDVGLRADGDGILPRGLGLAVIAGLADDVQIMRTAGGLSIRMSWPSEGSAG